MLALAIKGLWARKRMFAGTFLAVVLGVAFLSGVLALGDTLTANFSRLFTSAGAGTSAVVRSATAVGSGIKAPRTLIPASVLTTVRDVPGVAGAQPSITGYGQILGSDGNAVGGNGPPRTAGNWVTDPALNPYRIVQGRAPMSPDEVVINRGAATSGHLRVGDVTTVETPQPIKARIVGLADFGTAPGFGQSTFTAFTLQAAEKYLTGRPGKISEVLVAAAPGISQPELVSRIARVLPPGVQVISGTTLTQENLSAVNSQFLGFLNDFLFVFAAIALLVAVLTIANTFSILVVQRTRESALLRTVGAARRQVLGTVLTEAVIVGALASAVGLAAGLGLAGLLKGVFDSFGFALPAGGLDVTARSILVAVLVGLLATVAAGLVPAFRASRVTPLAALREGAAEASTIPPARTVTGAALSLLGLAGVVAGAAGSASPLAYAGSGAVLLVAGFAVMGPAVARLAAGITGPPIAAIRGLPGKLARANAMRSPRRSAAAATSLMVGVGVVTLFTVLGASLKTSLTDNVSSAFRGDVAITAGSFGGGMLPPQLATAVGRVPGVAVAAGIGTGNARIGGKGQTVAAVDPASASAVLDLHTVAGSLASLSGDQLAVSEHVARAQHWHIGTTLPVVFPDSTTARLRIGAIYRSRDLVGDYVLPAPAWYRHAVQPLDKYVFATFAPGTGHATVEQAIKHIAAAHGNPTVQDRAAFVKSAAQNVNLILGIVYVMLVLAVLIAVFGITNTLSLSVHERTRELGLLRAVGQTRRQLRSMVRLESLIVALQGTISGIVLGVLIGWGISRAANTTAGITTFTLPPAQIAVILAAGIAAGFLAAIRPAQRAARLPVLTAIASE
jgi:putative ABC transport system permease protein